MRTTAAAPVADATPRGPELARFALGVVASALLVVAALTMLLATGPGLLPGWRTTVVGSGSMEPALAVGDVVVVTEYPPTGPMLAAPSVVLVERPGLDPLLHRVLDDDGRTYRTKGDNNPDVDTDRVDPAHVLGVGRLLVPYGGWPALWWQRGELAPLLAAGLALAGLLWSARFGWSDAYDPWLLAARRSVAPASTPGTDADDDGTNGPGGAPGAGRGDDTGARGGRVDAVLSYADVIAGSAQPGRGERPVRRRRRGRLAAVAAVALALTGGTSLTASDSAFSSTTRSSGTVRATTVAPVTALSASCSKDPFVVDSVVAGPGEPAPAYPSATRVGDILLLSRAGQRSPDGNGGYLNPPVPNGWTTLITDVGSTGAFHALYTTTATSATGTVPHASTQADLLVVVRRGVVLADLLNGQVHDTGSTITAPSLDAPAPGLVFAFWAVARSSVVFSSPPGMTPVSATPPSTQQISVGAHRVVVTAPGPTGDRTTSLTDATSAAAAWGQNSSISAMVRRVPGEVLSWTASATAKVDGYSIVRNGTVVADLSGRATTSWTDPQTPSPTTTYGVVARLGNWKSLPTNVTAQSGGC